MVVAASDLHLGTLTFACLFSFLFHFTDLVDGLITTKLRNNSFYLFLNNGLNGTLK